MFCKMLGSIIENSPHWRIGPAHHTFHSVNGAEEVGFIDPFRPACSNKNVLGVSGHPDDFVRHDLANRKNQIVRSIGEKAVDLYRYAVIDRALRSFFDERSRHFTEERQIFFPFMNAKEIPRHLAEHDLDLAARHRVVSSGRGQDVGEFFAVVVPHHFRKQTGLGMKAREIRRDRQNTLSGAETVESRKERFPDLFQGK
jgi:hypothetical protein